MIVGQNRIAWDPRRGVIGQLLGEVRCNCFRPCSKGTSHFLLPEESRRPIKRSDDQVLLLIHNPTGRSQDVGYWLALLSWYHLLINIALLSLSVISCLKIQWSIEVFLQWHVDSRVIVHKSFGAGLALLVLGHLGLLRVSHDLSSECSMLGACLFPCQSNWDNLGQITCQTVLLHGQSGFVPPVWPSRLLG